MKTESIHATRLKELGFVEIEEGAAADQDDNLARQLAYIEDLDLPSDEIDRLQRNRLEAQFFVLPMNGGSVHVKDETGKRWVHRGNVDTDVLCTMGIRNATPAPNADREILPLAKRVLN